MNLSTPVVSMRHVGVRYGAQAALVDVDLDIAGLGRLPEEQRAAFDYRGLLCDVLVLVALSLIVDLVSAAARRSWR